MSSPSANLDAPPSRPGIFNYLHENTASSLHRNGLVLTKRDINGSDASFEGVTQKQYTVEVADARTLIGAQVKTCETNGFELLDSPLADAGLDFLNHEQVLKHYYGQCEELVAAATGAQAYAFDHNVRSAQGKNSQQRLQGGQQIQGPAKMVHGDYTLTSAPQRLRDLSAPPNVNDTLRSVLAAGQSLVSKTMVEQSLAEGGRFAIINLWRSIAPEPVQTNPLAMCDAQSVAPEDLVTFEIHYHDRIGENYFAKYSEAHRFYFFPEMTTNEPLLLKQWDSAGALARSDGEEGDASEPEAPSTFSFHSAFDDLSVPAGAPDRLSIEVRCLVIYPV